MSNHSEDILVTGATGFVGGFLVRRLLAGGFAVRGTLLPGEAPESLPPGVSPVTVEPLGSGTSWDGALAGVGTVVHLAARVHVMDETCANPLEEFRRVNVEGTLKLARDAVRAGVRRLVFVSSVKVNGEESPVPYRPDTPPNPSDPYGISKWEAERGLAEIAAQSGLELVVLRPTLVYGPGVRANFYNLMRTLTRGIPLPLAGIENRRSLVYVGNLVDALALAADHPQASGETYLVSDGEDVSTPELIRRTAAALGVPARLIPFPVPLMQVLGNLAGKGAVLRRLTGSLAVDNSKLGSDLGWRPPYTMQEGLLRTAQWFNGLETTR